MGKLATVHLIAATNARMGYEEHIPGQTRDWNEELQTTRELPRNSLPERLIRERAIFKVTPSFLLPLLLLLSLIWQCESMMILLIRVSPELLWLFCNQPDLATKSREFLIISTFPVHKCKGLKEVTSIVCLQVHSDFVLAATRGAVAVVDGSIMPINPGDEGK